MDRYNIDHVRKDRADVTPHKGNPFWLTLMISVATCAQVRGTELLIRFF